MKNIKRKIIIVLFAASIFFVASCGDRAHMNTEPEIKQEVTTVYQVSRIVEVSGLEENIYTVEYDDEGKPLFYKVRWDDGEITTAEIKYNDRGVLNSVKIDEEEYEVVYNEADNTAKAYEREEGGSTNLFMSCQYNSNNQIVSLKYYHGSGVSEDIYSYNDKGDINTHQKTDSFGAQSLREYVNTYDENNNLIRTKYCEGGNLWNFKDYTYDNNGNVISETIGSLFEDEVFGEVRLDTDKYEYTYDSNGNIATETVYNIVNNEYVCKREYSYITCNAAQNRKGPAFDITQLRSYLQLT